MSEHNANTNFDDFMSDFSHPKQTVTQQQQQESAAASAVAAAGNHGSSQFLINDDDEFGVLSSKPAAGGPPAVPPADFFTGGDQHHEFDQTFGMSAAAAPKPNPTTITADLLGDFLANERGGDAPAPAPKAFDVKAEIKTSSPVPTITTTADTNKNQFSDFDDHFKDDVVKDDLLESLSSKKDINEFNDDVKTMASSTTVTEAAAVDKEEDFGQIQPDYLNPYASSKLESNEKFISTDDLIGLSDNEAKENAKFEDCDKDEEDEEEFNDIPTASAPSAPEPAARQSIETVKTETQVEPTAPPASEPVVSKFEPQPAKQEPPPPSKPAKQDAPKKPVAPLEAEKLFKRIGLDSWFKPETLHPKVESLIYWRDVKKSGIVFGAGLTILLALSYCSLISVFAYVSLIVLAGTVAFRIYKNILQAVQKTSEGHPFKEYLEIDLTLSQERVQQVTTVAVSHVNAALTELRRLFLVEDLVDSIKFGVLLYCLTYVGALFNGMTLIILGFIALFSLPKVYETNQAVIDAQLDVVRSKVTEITDKVKAAIPIGKKAESDKDK